MFLGPGGPATLVRCPDIEPLAKERRGKQPLRKAAVCEIEVFRANAIVATSAAFGCSTIAFNTPGTSGGAAPATARLLYDQRGPPYARLIGGNVDIGAFEVDGDRIFANGLDDPRLY